MTKESREEKELKLGSRYQELRESEKNQRGKELSQRELSKKIHVANSRISEIESGKKTPTIHEVQAYYNFFEVSYEYLMGESENKNRDNVDIGNVFGLTDETIDVLKQIHKDDVDNSNGRMKALNSLISSENDLHFIKLLEEYMYYDLSRILGRAGAEILFEPLLKINASTISRTYLVGIQDVLIKLKEAGGKK